MPSRIIFYVDRELLLFFATSFEFFEYPEAPREKLLTRVWILGLALVASSKHLVKLRDVTVRCLLRLPFIDLQEFAFDI